MSLKCEPLQTGMKTNGGRKLLVASVEHLTTDGGCSPVSSGSGSGDSGPPYRSVLVVSRTMSGGSSTTATYAEVYTSHKTSSASTGTNSSGKSQIIMVDTFDVIEIIEKNYPCRRLLNVVTLWSRDEGRGGGPGERWVVRQWVPQQPENSQIP